MDYLSQVFIGPLAELVTDSPFKYFFWSSNAVAFFCWILTLLTDNYSQVDRLWSILPPMYSWGFLYFAVQTGQSSPAAFYRLILMAILPTIWGARLTYNFWRKDGYNTQTEDYRWIFVRKMFNYPQYRLPWHLFNFFFTAFLQNYLLLGLVLPMWKCLSSRVGFHTGDAFIAATFIFFLLVETVADQQQWKFQTNKYKWLASKKTEKAFSKQDVDDFKRGFFIKGLFAYSRHPNFFGEISIWWTYYLFSISSQFSSFNDLSLASFVNYSLLGTLVLTLLFHASTNLTEKISVEKYPEYKKYQKYVSRIIPFFTTYNPK